mgnify:CR=1 FL=1
METELLLRICAIIIAGGILLSTVSWIDILSKVKLWFKRSPVNKPSPEPETDFLEIVGLWHTLKDKCTIYGLDQAVEKLDEVFPLLNVEEDDKDV